jgi:hypothetical protein
MSTSRRSLGLIAVALGLIACFVMGYSAQSTATENSTAANQSGNVPQYTVVQTDGLHLIVTDNKSSTTYFYAIDEGEKPGADLKLRGSVDLTQIGKEVIKPNLVKRN